jgi:hypothetical protein
MRRDPDLERDRENGVCTCCGQQLPARGKLSLQVDEAVLSLCNRAYDEAVRMGSPQVEIAHLVVCLASSVPSRLVAAQIDDRALRLSAERWLEAHTRRTPAGGRHASRASDDLKTLLARAERYASRRGAAFATLDDVVTVVLSAGQKLASASFVQSMAAERESHGAGRRESTREIPREIHDRERLQHHWSDPEAAHGLEAEAAWQRRARSAPTHQVFAPQSLVPDAFGTAEPHPSHGDRPDLFPEERSSREGRASNRQARSPDRDAVVARQNVWQNDAGGGMPAEVLDRLEGLERAIASIGQALSQLVERDAERRRAATASASGSSSSSAESSSASAREGAASRARDARDGEDGAASRKRSSASSRTSGGSGRRSWLERFRRRRRLDRASRRQRTWREAERQQNPPRRERERFAPPRLSLAASRDPHEADDADLGEPDDDGIADGGDAGSAAREKRFYLHLDNEVVRAPSIGPRTAERLSSVGVMLVRHLLACDPERAARQLGYRFLTAARIRDLQAQARLVCTIPWLRGTHAQLLVGAGYRTLDDIVAVDAEEICAGVLRFAATREGQSVLRAGPPPSIERITHWVHNAALAEPERAAA